MRLRFDLALSLLGAVASGAAAPQTDETLPACPFMTEATVPEFHQNNVCDRIDQSSSKARQERNIRHNAIRAHGLHRIPNQETVVCPQTTITPADALDTGLVGHDTRWIMENKSSSQVVVAFVLDGKEYSAMNPTISPPQADSEAIVKVGEWRVINTYEGHVFHVRELLPDGRLGDVLLQHRAGLVEFTNRFGQDLGDCNVNEVEHATTTTTPNSQQGAPSLQRTLPPSMLQCNLVYQGFRNSCKCPLHVYYAGMQDDTDLQECNGEKFRFHLGNEAKDDTTKWTERHKFEGILSGHTFVARLAFDPSIIVDSFTLQPTQVRDCPNRSRRAESTVVQMEMSMGIEQVLSNDSNITSTRAWDFSSLSRDMFVHVTSS